MRDEKRSEIIHDALNYLDDEMIEDVENLRAKVDKKEFEQSSNAEKQRNWKKWTALAASICVLILGGWMVANGLIPQIAPAEDNASVMNESLDGEGEFSDDEIVDEIVDEIEDMEGVREESAQATLDSMKIGVRIPQMEVNLKKAEDGIAVDMLGFFILNGRSYIQYEFQRDYVEQEVDFVGEYAGSITGMIDEWTEADGYVEGAGTYTGDVFEVKGVSPEFMLCMVWEDGSVETFINNNGITLCKGSDLVDDRVHLRDNFNAVSIPTEEDGQIKYTKLPLTEDELDVFTRFLDAFAEGDFVYVEEKLEYPFGSDEDTTDMMDFYFVKENGVRLRFRTLGDGYVSFPWIDACVQIDQELYDEVVDILIKNIK